MRQLSIVLLLLLVATPLAAQQRTVSPSTNLLNAAIAPASSEAKKPLAGNTTFLARGATTAGSGAATIVIEVTNVETPTADTQWVTAGTIALTLGTTETAAGMVINAPWRNVRARLSAISGTNASVTVDLASGY